MPDIGNNELDGKLTAQLFAAHNTAMERYGDMFGHCIG